MRVASTLRLLYHCYMTCRCNGNTLILLSTLVVASAFAHPQLAVAKDPQQATATLTLPELNPEKLENSRRLWRLPNINPEKDEIPVGVFHYGLLIGDRIFYSVVHQKEARIGQRAGGHFKILREAYRISALLEGRSEDEAALVAAEVQRRQATFNLELKNVKAFGFKVVQNGREGLAIKWHGFNSFKSSLHGNHLENQDLGHDGERRIIFTISKILGLPSVMAHPIDDPDLLLNPKYLDRANKKVYRGEVYLWEITKRVLDLVEAVNAQLGHKIDARRYLTPGTLGVCERLKAIGRAVLDGLFG